jgi:DNA-binding CsgD family transcriptional regulator
MRWGRYDEARRRLTSAADIAARHGYQVVRTAALVTLLRLDYLTGGQPGLAERAQEWAGTAEEPVSRLEAQLLRAELTLATAGNDPGQVEDQLKVVQEECVRRGIIAQWLDSAAARARLRLCAGDAAGALAVTEDGMRLVLDKGIWLWATQIAPARVAALIAAGQAPEAERLADAFAGGLRERRMPAPQASLAECQAALMEGRGEFKAAAAAWDLAAQAWSQLPRPQDAARAQAAAGRCLRAARGTRPSGRRGYGGRLSPREREVVRLMLDGMTNRQIARELSKSPDTVAAQLKSAMRKYGVTSRTALAVSVTQAEAGIL